MKEFIEPNLELNSYSCPHCHAFAGMELYELKLAMNVYSCAWQEYHGRMEEFNIGGNTESDEDLKILDIVTCRSCDGIQIWLDNEMIYPDVPNVPSPNANMPEAVRQIYDEASSVFQKSPRAAAALLRLAVQKLCIELGLRGKNIDDDIKELIKRGLPESIQKALDAVRVIGNNAVHPGAIDLNENKKIVLALFKILNFIVEKMISDKQNVNDIYDLLPEGAKEAIEIRNRKVKENN